MIVITYLFSSFEFGFRPCCSDLKWELRGLTLLLSEKSVERLPTSEFQED